MLKKRLMLPGLRFLATVALAITVIGCPMGEEVEKGQAQSEMAKIPITTRSEEARDFYIQGRDLAEKLRATDSREYFQLAVAEDKDFALAHLALANTAPTNTEFFNSLERAANLAAGSTEPEQWMILAAQAAIRSEPEIQRSYLKELIEAYPDDERARNLIGAFHFGRQEYAAAVTEYTKAIEINPEFSPPYNQLGYAQRFLGDHEAAEQTFTRYIELLPGEPNPYDSYAELLMKMGRFDDSINKYRLALEANPDFVFSYIGIANNQIFLGQSEEARASLQELYGKARTDGERRQALFWTTASHLHDKSYDAAMDTCRKMSAISEATGDMTAMAGDQNLMGNILLASGRPEESLSHYRKAIDLTEQAEVMEEVKENARRNLLFQEARVALAGGDFEMAKSKTMAYGELVAAKGIPFEIRQHHELRGRIALHESDYEVAVAELSLANQQNPRILYYLAQASRGAGDLEAARATAQHAAAFNALNINYAYVRADAQDLLDELNA